MINYFLIGLGGALGSIIRYGIAQLTPNNNYSFPYSTILANVISCFILGLSVSLFSRGLLDEKQKLFLVTGFCGGLSTFSTFTYENIQLFESGEYLLCFVNILFSVFICFIFLFLGLKLF